MCDKLIMNIFTKREVFITRTLNEMNRVRGCLETNGIKHDVKTNYNTSAGRNRGIPFINTDYLYEYRIYVHKNDLERAKYVINRKNDKR